MIVVDASAALESPLRPAIMRASSWCESKASERAPAPSWAGCSAADIPLRNTFPAQFDKAAFSGRLFTSLVPSLAGRRVSRRRSGLKAVAPAPICEQQIGQMRAQEHNSPRKKRKSNQT
jgi:hypothetical protein